MPPVHCKRLSSVVMFSIDAKFITELFGIAIIFVVWVDIVRNCVFLDS